MKVRIAVIAVVLASAGLLLAQEGGFSLPERKKKAAPTRTLTGQVMNKDDAPMPEAIVHLRNTKTLAERTFITNAEGNYRFNALSLTQDYEIYAEASGKRSGTKTLSQFDSRPEPRINLKIE